MIVYLINAPELCTKVPRAKGSHRPTKSIKPTRPVNRKYHVTYKRNGRIETFYYFERPGSTATDRVPKSSISINLLDQEEFRVDPNQAKLLQEKISSIIADWKDYVENTKVLG